LKYELNTNIKKTFSFVETSKYLIFHSKSELTFFEKIDEYYFIKSEFCIKKEKVNTLYYDEKLEALLINFYYSNEISLFCLRTLKEIQRYHLGKFCASICFYDMKPLFFATDFSGHIYKFSYLSDLAL